MGEVMFYMCYFFCDRGFCFVFFFDISFIMCVIDFYVGS